MAVTIASLVLTAPLSADDEVLVSYRSLTPEVALEMALAAQASCREKGYQVTVAVVDRMVERRLQLLLAVHLDDRDVSRLRCRDQSLPVSAWRARLPVQPTTAAQKRASMP